MFGNVNAKLEDCRVIFEQLRASTAAPSFRASFNSFLSAARAVTYSLQKDGRNIAGFSQWYEAKQNEMRNDELLRFIHEARTEDFHEGRHRLVFGTYIKYFSTAEAGSPPADNARIIVGGEGIYWLVDEGTPNERRIPINKGGAYSVHVAVKNAPKVHLGKKLERNDAITICDLALYYFSKLVHEARTKFHA